MDTYFPKISCLLLILAFKALLLCANVPLEFMHYNTTNGLSNNDINCILQDRDGFLWIGTEFGLNRFDGYYFESFTHNANDTTSIASNLIHYLYEDAKKNIWVGTLSSLDSYSKKEQRFIHHFVHYDTLQAKYYLSEHPSPTNLNAYCFEQDSIVWLGLSNRSIIRYNLDKGTSITFGPENCDFFLSSAHAKRIRYDGFGKIWIATSDNGIYAINLSNYAIKNYRSSPKGLSSNAVQDILISGENEIWAATYGYGLNQYVPEKDAFQFFPYHSKQNLQGTNFILSLTDCQDGNLLAATDDGGLNIINKKTHEVTLIKHEDNEPSSISNDVLRTVYCDHQGNLWVGSYQYGINFSSYRNKKKFSTSLSGSSLKDYRINTILEDSEGNVWFGTDESGIMRYSKKSQRFDQLLDKLTGKVEIPLSSILTIYEDSKKNIWIGTYLGGAYCYTPSSQDFKQYLFTNPSLNSSAENDIRSIIEDQKGRIWLSSNEGGLYILDPKTSDYQILSTKESGFDLNGQYIIHSKITCLLKDHHDNIWIGTYGGISIYLAETNSIINAANLPNSPIKFNSNTILDMQLNNDHVWIGTQKGLAMLKLDGSELKMHQQILKQHGLPHDAIQSVQKGAFEELWLGTDHGISKYHPLTGEIRTYQSHDGFPSNNFRKGAHEKLESGRLIFGTNSGFVTFMPEDIQADTVPPKTAFTSLSLYNTPVNIGQEYHGQVLLTKAINETEELVFNHRQKSFTIGFVGIHFLNPKLNSYQFKLEGYDDEWTHCNSNARFATYAGLPPGKYTFLVRVFNPDGYSAQEPLSMPILIKPPFWSTWWFRSFIAAVSLLLFIVAYLLRVRNIKWQNLNLELQIQERTSEIREKNRLLEEKTHSLNVSKQLLESKQHQIQEQTLELKSQKKDLERMNTQLKESNATKDKFFSILAHDLKNPFNALLGFAQILHQYHSSWKEDKRSRIIKSLYEVSNTTYNLLDNLLQWSRSQRDALTAKPVDIPVSELILSNITVLQDSALSKRIQIINQLEKCHDKVFVDMHMINTVLRNLISNAIKFSKPGDTITIDRKIEDGFMIIEIRDEGIGISNKDQLNLFQVEENITREGTAKEMGTGLGLIVSKEFVEKNGGQIWAESIENKGSSFYFSIPVSKDS